MDSRREVFRETLVVLLGEIIVYLIMIGIFALSGYLDGTVWLGGAVGVVLAVGNFFLMAMNVDMAADRAVNEDVQGGKNLMRSSYIIRLILIFGILLLLVKSGRCNAIASIVPLALVRWILTIAEFFRKKGGA
ncbi:MAG: ATP synthase subunit I [Clostridiales bacterium]|nr:ATP synthase subunit I [Clostridia bacterium]MCR4882301.1 ATP synthase subunit I [Clostridiales bacterium]